jgi:hypothetical protein
MTGVELVKNRGLGLSNTTKRLTVPNSVAAKFSDMPSVPAARYVIRRRTYTAHWFRLSRPIMQRSRDHAELASSFARCIHTAAYQ